MRGALPGGTCLMHGHASSTQFDRRSQMIILGINAYHGDVSAALLRDGELVAAVEEERLRRVKHWAGFPRESIRACLDLAKAAPADIDHFAISRNPRANLWRKALFALGNRPGPALVADRLKNRW